MILNPFSISCLLLIVTCVSVIAIILIYSKRLFLHWLWILFNTAVLVWGIGGFLVTQTRTEAVAVALFKFALVGVIFTSALFFHVVYVLCGLRSKITLAGAYILCSLAAMATLAGFFTELEFMFNSFYYPVATGSAYPLLYLTWLLILGYAYHNLFKSYRRSHGIKRNQLLYLFLSSAIGFIGGAINFLPAFGSRIYPYSNFAISAYCIIATYSIIRYRFLDVRIIVTRAGIFSIVYSLVLGIPFWLGYATKAWFLATTLAVLFATSGPFIYTYLRRRTERVLLKEQKRYQKALLDISSTMMLIKELDRLLKTIVLKVLDIVGVSWAAVYLKDEKESGYVLKYKHARSGKADHLPDKFSLDSRLISHLHKSKLPIIGEELNHSDLKVGLAVPCFIEDNLLGFLLLGEKPKGQMYTSDDINVFAILSNQTALAIENCQYYSQERQREHFRRIAVLDHQMDCMAHEILNPVNNVLGSLGSIELTIDELKDTLPQEKHDYLKQKLSRATFNSKRIAKMIDAVKEFSKPTTGELSVITLQNILESFNYIMQPQFKHFIIDFIQDLPQEDIWLRANKVEMEQILVNLAVNSVQAIAEVKPDKREIKLKAYRTGKDNSTLKIELSDTGAGIEKGMLEEIFLDFVTTKASSVGTGLGLSIARKNITKRNGKIWAESEGENKGATFHIELPIPKDITDKEKKKSEDDNNRGNIVF